VSAETIVVSGAIANKCRNGGEAWVRLSWIRGFQQLGFRVVFVERIARESCVDDAGRPAAFEDSANLAYFRDVTRRFGLEGDSALVHEGGTHGLTMAELMDVAGEAALLVNISGHLDLAPLLGRMKRKAYVDIDPGFTQFWHAAGQEGSRLAGHDYYFTIGENIGRPECSIPTGGIPWVPTRQPVTLGDWPVSTGAEPGRFTTIANWRGPYGPIEYGGRTFGLKVHEFRKVLPLPARARQRFELALSIHPAESKDLHALREHGWDVVDPGPASADPESFRSYVQRSGSEFSVAQGVYVDTASGWFSDRTARYLASGKPALVQDTGFGRALPVGEGLVPFRTLDDAVAGAERIARDYAGHCEAARAIAEEHFTSDRVLGEMLARVGVGG
jgi:hypothetical protein